MSDGVLVWLSVRSEKCRLFANGTADATVGVCRVCQLCWWLIWQGSSSSVADSYAAVLARRAAAEEERRNRAEQRRLARSACLRTWTYLSITVLRPLYRSTCISRHLQLRTGGFCWCKVLPQKPPQKTAKCRITAAIYWVRLRRLSHASYSWHFTKGWEINQPIVYFYSSPSNKITSGSTGNGE